MAVDATVDKGRNAFEESEQSGNENAKAELEHSIDDDEHQGQLFVMSGLFSSVQRTAELVKKTPAAPSPVVRNRL